MIPRLVHGLQTRHDLWFAGPGDITRLPDMSTAELLHTGPHSRIWRHPGNPGLVSKLFLLKSPLRDGFRRYWQAQAQREFRSSMVLQQLGLATPTMVNYFIPAAFWKPQDSLLFMRELPPHQMLSTWIKQNRDESQRLALIKRLACETGQIYIAGQHHKDCHPENVLVSPEQRLIWIDCDLRATKKAQLQSKRLQKTLYKLVGGWPEYFSEAETHYFADSIEKTMTANTWSRTVASPALAWFREQVPLWRTQ